MKDYYSILDVPSDASQDKIRNQYRLLLHAWHPDKFPVPEQKVKAEEKTKEFNEAYNILSKPDKRAQYDQEYSFQSSNFDHTEKDREQKKQQRRTESAKQHTPQYEQQRQEQAEAKRQRVEAELQRKKNISALDWLQDKVGFGCGALLLLLLIAFGCSIIFGTNWFDIRF